MSIILLSYLFSNLYDGLKLGKEPDNFVDPGEKTVVELEKNYPGVYVDYDDNVAFDARGFLSERALIDITNVGSGATKKRVIEVSLAGSVKVQ